MIQILCRKEAEKGLERTPIIAVTASALAGESENVWPSVWMTIFQSPLKWTYWKPRFQHFSTSEIRFDRAGGLSDLTIRRAGNNRRAVINLRGIFYSCLSRDWRQEPL